MADELNSDLDRETSDAPEWGDAAEATPAEETVTDPAAVTVEPVVEAGAAEEVAVDEVAYQAPNVEPAAAAAASHASVRAEQERLQAERAARREARLAALNPQPEPIAPAALVETRQQTVAVEPTVVERVHLVRSTDKFWGAFGLFLVRLVVAAILGVRGVNHLLNLSGTTDLIATTVLPMPAILAIVLASAEIAVALALVFGVLTRLAGVGVAAIAGSALGFVLWGAWSPFRPGEPGFTGELELLLVAVGLLLLFVGGGGWAVDRAFRSRRDADRLADA